MTEQEKGKEVAEKETVNVTSESVPKNAGKRDIFRFRSEEPTAINLEHVTKISVSGKRITFEFYSTAMYVDLEDEVAALSVFEQILNVWAG